ncbi:MAG: N-acetylmuramoyl-L-alanine amidase [Clostridia bacterium]|nr:N-acetylmuramoyl-L-alanine amidase [Clostridia bacterium]
MNKEGPFLYSLRFFLLAVITIGSIAIMGLAITSHLNSRKTDTSLPVFGENDEYMIVIDPGHGGEDAGAIASDGTLEKDLNLEISNLLYALCQLNCTDAKMTRTEDTLLYDYYNDLSDYTGQKKVYDLKNRLKITESEENPVYVGIHMNKFSQSKYSGAQIYYSSNNDKSKELAGDLRSLIKTHLQRDNNRNIKKADSSIYILNNINAPAILVECGFLSNEKELSQLKDESYRSGLALTIFASICDL